MRREIVVGLLLVLLGFSLAFGLWQAALFSLVAIIALNVDSWGFYRRTEGWSRGRRLLLEFVVVLLLDGAMLALAPRVTPYAAAVFVPIGLLWLILRWRALGHDSGRSA